MVNTYNNENFDLLTKEGVTFFDFFATWCYPCNMMMPVVDSLSDELTNVKFYKVDVDKYQDLAIKFRINTIPRFLIFKDGELKDQIVGALDEDELKKRIEACMM